MNHKVWIADTGFLVAIFHPQDTYHAWAVRELGKISIPLITCEAVLTEVLYLLRRYSVQSYDRFLASIAQKNWLQTPFRLTDSMPEVLNLLSRYNDTPMDFADACLVRMVEQYTAAQSVILTIDKDFWVYRVNQTQSIQLIIPPDRQL